MVEDLKKMNNSSNPLLEVMNNGSRRLYGKIGYRPIYNPTPNQIASECVKIQAGWNESTRKLRETGVAVSINIEHKLHLSKRELVD